MEGFFAFLLLLALAALDTYTESKDPEKLRVVQLGADDYALYTRTTNVPVFRGTRKECQQYLRDRRRDQRK